MKTSRVSALRGGGGSLKSLILGCFNLFVCVSKIINRITKNTSNRQKVLVLIEPGGIGDYIFCRPFFKFIKQSPKYRDYKVVYIAQEHYADFVNKYDKEYFDEVISYNLNALRKNEHYKKYFYSLVNEYNVDTLWSLRTNGIPQFRDPGYRRRLAKNIKAKHKIVDILIHKKNLFMESKIKFYNEPLYADSDMPFELERRRRIFSRVLGIDIPVQSLGYLSEDIKEKLDNYIVLSIRAQGAARMLPDEKWKVIVANLQKKYPDKKLVFIGSVGDFDGIQKFIDSLSNSANCINFAGKTPIEDLPEFLKHCDFMIAVETGTVHIGNLVGCKTICLSCGSFYTRFHPYEQGSVSYVYPERFKEIFSSDECDKLGVYCGDSPCLTAELDVEDLI